MTFIDHFSREDGALGNNWGHSQGSNLWTISSQAAVSGSCTGRDPNMSQSLTSLGTQLRRGFTFSFKWQHNQNSATNITPGLIFTLDPAGVAGVQWEAKAQASDGHVQYQFNGWGGTLEDEFNPLSANDTWHEAEYIVRPSSLTFIVDGVTLANDLSHEIDLSVFDNPVLSFYCEPNEGSGVDPQFQIDWVKLVPVAGTVGILRA